MESSVLDHAAPTYNRRCTTRLWIQHRPDRVRSNKRAGRHQAERRRYVLRPQDVPVGAEVERPPAWRAVSISILDPASSVRCCFGPDSRQDVIAPGRGGMQAGCATDRFATSFGRAGRPGLRGGGPGWLLLLPRARC